MAAIDWQALFVPSGSLVELIARGTLMYFAILAAFRVSRRNVGSLAVSDLLVLVLVADAAQNGMAGEYKSVTEGVVLVATIFIWDQLLDALAYRVPAIRPLLQAGPLPLVKDGRVIRTNLRREMITIDELMAQLREHGVDELAQVKRCCLESDGQISVIQTADRGDADRPKRRSAV